MAKQAEGFIVGTIDDITFYKMYGHYYARMKSSLTGKKFWRHRSFAGSRRSCNRFGKGNRLASLVYNEIAEGERKYEKYCLMKKTAIALIKAGCDDETVMDQLRLLKPKVVSEVEETVSSHMKTIKIYIPLSRYNISIIKLPGIKLKIKRERLYAVG